MKHNDSIKLKVLTSTGLVETSELAQMAEQRRYMMDRDDKLDARDQNILDKGYMDSKNSYIDKDGYVKFRNPRSKK